MKEFAHMSIYPSPDKLDNIPEGKPSKYSLVIMAAKRARQVKDGARRLTDSRSTNPLTVALEEMAAGAIIPREVEDVSVTAYHQSLKPNEPSLEDIIGAGPVLAIEPELDSAAAQLEAFRNAEPDADDNDLLQGDDSDEEITPIDRFEFGSASHDSDDDEEVIPELEEDND